MVNCKDCGKSRWGRCLGNPEGETEKVKAKCPSKCIMIGLWKVALLRVATAVELSDSNLTLLPLQYFPQVNVARRTGSISFAAID